MVKMASGIAGGRVRTKPTAATPATTTRTSHNVVAIFQPLGHAALVYNVHLWYWTSILWLIDTCQDRVSADQYNVTIRWTQVLRSSRSHII